MLRRGGDFKFQEISRISASFFDVVISRRLLWDVYSCRVHPVNDNVMERYELRTLLLGACMKGDLAHHHLQLLSNQDANLQIPLSRHPTLHSQTWFRPT